MAEFRQHPDPTPRGRHAQRRTARSNVRDQGLGPSGYPPARVSGINPAGEAFAGNTGGQIPGAYGRDAYGSRGKRGSSRKGGPWRIVFWAALVVLVASLLALGVVAFSYWQGQDAYDSVAEEVFTPPSDIDGAALSDLEVDWDALLAINPDTVGWIYIPGTAVNYPIVHTTDNETYLTHDFQGSQGWVATFGSIFLAAENVGDFSDENNLVYGHHLNNGSMFASLADFDDSTHFNEHRTIYILTPQGNYRLTTFSLVHCAADDPLAQVAFSDDAERTSYVQDKIDRSVVVADPVAPVAADITHMFAFITCDNLPANGRYVLFASVAESTVATTTSSDTNAADDSVSGSDVVDPDAAAIIDDAAKEIVA